MSTDNFELPEVRLGQMTEAREKLFNKELVSGKIPRKKPENDYDSYPWEEGKAVRYKVVEGIATGGYGRIFRGKDVKLGREVAIKVVEIDRIREGEINPLATRDLGDGDKVVVLEREAKVLAKIRHRGVVQVYDFMKAEVAGKGRVAAIIEEYIDPKEASILYKLIGSADMNQPLTTVTVISNIARVIEDLARDGVYQNDLTPRNIFIYKNGEVKLVDFGISNLVFHEYKGKFAAGTKPFVAPELVNIDDQGEVGRTSEVYSLAVVAAVILSRSVSSAYDFHEVGPLIDYVKYQIGVVCRDEDAWKRLAKDDVDEYASGIWYVLEKGIAANPAVRYQTPLEFAKALRKAIIG